MISFEPYFNRLISLDFQFELAQKAILSFKNTPQAIEHYLEGEIEDLRETIVKAATEHKIDPSTTWAFQKEHVDKYRGHVRSSLSTRFPEIENRLRQNALILRVAIFEAFMKDIHREARKQKPSLIRSDRTVPLGRIIGVGWEKVLEEEIEREVQALDRKSSADRAKYFREVLGIDWLSGTIVPLLEVAIDTRNAILHDDPDKVVDEVMELGVVRLVCFTIPWVSVAQAALLYPGGFEMIEGVTEKEARQLLKVPM